MRTTTRKNRKEKPGIYPVYDLSGDEFRQVEITTRQNRNLKGQFVRFKVVEDGLEYIYPSEKLCFLPEKNKEEFWKAYKKNKGEFAEFPGYVVEVPLSNIKQITIEPQLVK